MYYYYYLCILNLNPPAQLSVLQENIYIQYKRAGDGQMVQTERMDETFRLKHGADSPGDNMAIPFSLF